MQDLINDGLHGEGLVKLTPERIRRYNDCLIDVGIEPTKLEEFGIDAVGWSPQLANEVLSNGEKRGKDFLRPGGIENPLVIIVTPEQEHAPIFNPSHSFDWELIKQLYYNNRTQIAELTRHTAFWFEVEQGADVYHSREELLLLDNIIIKVFTPSRLIVKAREQKALVGEFMHEEDELKDTVRALSFLPQKIEASVQDVGNVAHKPIIIEDMSFAIPRNFFINAFDGTFVLRSVDGEKELLLEKEKISKSPGVTSAADKRFLKKLEDFGLISYETEYWLDKLHRLEIIRDSFLMDVLSTIHPEMDYVSLSKVKQKSILAEEDVRKSFPEEYVLLDQLIKKLIKKKIPKKINRKILPYLAHPADTLDDGTNEVIWYVLALICDGRPVVRLYRYDKEAFIDAYSEWETPWKTWSRKCIRENYEYRMMNR